MGNVVANLNLATYIRNLKIKISRFESGREYKELKERIGVLVRENARLENKVLSQQKKYDYLFAKYKKSKIKNDDADEIYNEFERLLKEIDRLEKENERLKKEKEESNKKLTESNQLSEALRKQLNKDSSNSSIPSSFNKPNHKRRANEYNSREKSNHHVGGQLGHGHHPRKSLPPTSSINLALTEEMKNNSNLIKTGKTISKKLVDVEFCFKVTEYIADIYLDTITNKEVHAPFPSGVKDEINYGTTIKTFIIWLSNYCNVSINKIQDLISELSGGQVVPSTGYINKLQTSFVKKASNDIVSIENSLILSNFLHVDLTAGNLNGKQVNVFNFTNKEKVLYTYSESKNKEAMKETILGKFVNALIHDHDTTFYSFGDREQHQECLSHILRYLTAAIEESPDLTWHKEMKNLFQEVIHKKKNNEFISYDETISRFLSIIDNGLEEYKKYPPNKYETDGPKLLRRLAKYSKENFLFLKNDLIDYTNNCSERNLRKYKRKQKQAIVFRSSSSIESICAFLSIVETAKINGQSGFKAIQSIVA